MKFDSDYFDKHNVDGGEVAEFTHYDEYTMTMPKPTDYDIFKPTDKGGFKFNGKGVLNYLRDCGIVFDNSLPRVFDGRIYRPMSDDELERAVRIAINDVSDVLMFDFLPSINDVRNIVLSAKATLRVHEDTFPKEEIAELMDGAYVTKNQPLVAFLNGVLNTETGRLLPFTPKVFLTSLVHVNYDPTVRMSGAKDVLEGILPQQETIDFLFEMIGYILFNDTMYPPALFNLYGPGNTGKSAIANMIKTIVGSENTTEMGVDQITARFGTWMLDGKRLNICGETGGASSRVTGVNGETLKKLSNGDYLEVEKKSVNMYGFVNHAKLLFATNKIPDFGDDSSGLYRRLYVIPCRVQQDKRAKIYDRLVTPESLSWVVNMSYRAHLSMIANGNQFTTSSAMDIELDQFKSQDTVMDFLQGVFESTDPTTVARKITEDGEYSFTVNLYEAYVEYTRSALSQPLSRKRFHEKIRNEFNLKTKVVSYSLGGRSTTRTKYML